MYRTLDRLMFTLAAIAPGALSAQYPPKPVVQTAAAESPEPLVGHTFSLTAHERITVKLSKGESYRIELDGPGIRLELRPAQPGMQQPRIQKLLSGTGVAGTTLSLVRPLATGDYFLETAGGDPGRPVRVTLTLEPHKERKTD